MNYPEALLLPLLMIADYYLTLWGARLTEGGYSEHFAREHYELNPRWQQAIAERRRFNPRHLVLTAVLSAAIILIAESGVLPQWETRLVVGMVLTMFTMVLGRHIGNIVTFRYLIRSPSSVEGQVTMTHRFGLVMSLSQLLLVLLPLLLLAWLTRNSYAAGGALGIGALLLVHVRWLRGSD